MQAYPITDHPPPSDQTRTIKAIMAPLSSDEKTVEIPPSLTNMRVRITNRVSGRSKDLLVNVDKGSNLYSAVYDNPSVKAANVRKWSSQIVKEIKSKQSEIICLLWNEATQKAIHTFSIDDLRATSTRQLAEILVALHSSPDESSHGLVQLVLESSKLNIGESSRDMAISPTSSKQPLTLKETSHAIINASEGAPQSPGHHPGHQSDRIPEPADAKEAENKSTMLVRVSNETSQRYKDIVVSLSDDTSVFDSIYNNVAIKSAHVRKWTSDIVREVKAQTSEIVCSLMDEKTGKPTHTYSISDMQNTSMKQLLELHRNNSTESDKLVKLVLRCKKKNASAISSSDMASKAKEPISPRPGRPLPPHPDSSFNLSENASSRPRVVDTSTSVKSSLNDTTSSFHEGFEYHALSPRSRHGKNHLRVRVENETTGRLKDLLVKIDDNSSLFDAVYNNKSVKDANVRKWGSEIAQEVKDKISEIKCLVWDESIEKPFHTFSVEELKTTSTKKLFEIAAEPLGVIKLVLRCEKKMKSASILQTPYAESLAAALSLPKPTHGEARMSSIESIESMKSRSIFEFESLKTESRTDSLFSVDIKKETMRVRIANQKTKRFKDLVVDIRGDLSLYEAIYDNRAVKEANIRKWGSEIARDVKAGVSEIQLLLWDDSAKVSSHSFSVADLKTTSTKDLIDMAPVANDLVQLHLRCVKKSDATNDSISENSSKGIATSSPNSSKGIATPRDDASSANSDLMQSKGSAPARHMNHMSLAHLGAKHMNFASRNPSSLLSGRSKKDSVGSIPNLHSSRANSQFGMSGLKNAAWSPREPNTTKQPNLFSTHLDTMPPQAKSTEKDNVPSSHSLSPFSPSVGNSVHGGTSAKMKQSLSTPSLAKRTIFPRSYEKVVSTIDDKLQRFLRLSDTKADVKSKRLTESQSSTNIDSNSFARSAGSQSSVSIDPLYRRSTSGMNLSQATISLSVPEHAVVSTEDNAQRFLAMSPNTVGGEQPRRYTADTPMQRRRSSTSDSSIASLSTKDDPIKHFLRLCRTKRNPREIEADAHGTSRNSSVKIDGADEKIKRFLRLSHQSDSTIENWSESSLSAPMNEFDAFKSVSVNEVDARKSALRSEHGLLNKKVESEASLQKAQSSKDSERLKRSLKVSSEPFVPPLPNTPVASKPNYPPIAEIVITNTPTSLNRSDRNQVNSAPDSSGIALSGVLVKEVFPYHVVVDADFRIIQVGNSLSMLFDDSDEQSGPRPEINFIGRIVSDIFMVTGPVPMYGKWDWSILGRMKEKTIFIESVLTDEITSKARLKGTMIEISKSPRQIMFSLLPNVKNLSELSNMNLSMGDLPLHSCQREAVLLGEHSASEVKLTNHLDMLHRDLINSMEQQIKDRTAEVAMANQDLELANTQIQQQSARQLEHFACMSHEIRTPLNCIVGMSSILLEESDKVDPMHAESIQMIYNSGELLRAVVDDVLDYAKLESGSFEVDIRMINLQESLAGVVHSISQKIQEKNIRLRCHFSPTLPVFTETDSRRLQQVLFNLLGNSGKFSKRNSVIDLTVTLIPKSEKDKSDPIVAVGGLEHPNALDDNDIIRFSVKDYGKGIDKKDFTTIFQAFSQASKQTATVYGGTGLGLSITSNLVKRLGGIISLDSELEKFAEFIVDLPFKGEPVDTDKLKKQLKGVAIVVVQPSTNYDYSFTTYPIEAEPGPFHPNVVQQYELDVISCTSLANLAQKLEGKSEKSKHFALLVQENLYDEHKLAVLTGQLGAGNCTFMTFGQNGDIEATKQRHFRSILGLFPSSLLDSIVNHVTRTQQEVLFASTSSAPSPDSKKETHGVAKILSSTSSSGESKEKRPVQDLSSKNGGHSAGDKAQNGNKTAGPKKPSKAAPPDRNMKVLYAEDNKINQKVLSRVLTRVGIKDITVVDDGLKAVNVSEKEKFDLIFMDMQMPIMDGMEATNIIVGRDKDAKVIFVTAHALDEFKYKAEAAGAVSFISKPFRVQDIERVLDELGFN